VTQPARSCNAAPRCYLPDPTPRDLLASTPLQKIASSSLVQTMSGRVEVSVTIAFRVAKLMDVSLYDVISGTALPPGPASTAGCRARDSGGDGLRDRVDVAAHAATVTGGALEGGCPGKASGVQRWTSFLFSAPRSALGFLDDGRGFKEEI
jgi:hypothetical protein